MVGMVLFAVVIGTLAFRLVEDHLVARSGETLALAAGDIADKLDLFLSERHAGIRIMAQAQVFQGQDHAAMAKHLQAVQEAYPMYLWLGVTDARGRIVAATNPLSVGTDWSRTPWFQTVRSGGRINVRDAEAAEESDGALAVTYTAPIAGPQGNFLGVVTARIWLPTLEDLFVRTVIGLQAQHGTSGRVEYQFLTRDGTLIADSILREEGRGNLKRLGLPSATLYDTGPPGYVEENHSRRLVPVVTGYAQIRGSEEFPELRWGILVRMDRDDILGPVRAIIVKLGLAGAAVCVPLFGLLLWTNRRLLQEWQRAGEEARRATEADARMQAHETRTRVIVDQALDAIITVDCQDRITGWNLQAEVIFGWPRQDVIGLTFSEIAIPSPYWEPYRRGFTQDLESSEGPVSNRRIEVAARHRSGREFPVELSIALCRTSQDISFSIFVRDITDRARAEQHLATQHAVTRILAESTTLGEAAPRILASICMGLEWDLGALWLVDRQAQLLRCAELWCTSASETADFESQSRRMTFPPGVGLPGRVWSSSRSVWIADVAQDDNFPCAPLAVKEGLHSAFAFPILLGQDVLGVLEFFTHATKLPGDDIRGILTAIGSQIGQFIERRQAEESQRRLVAILEATTDFVATADRQGRALYINRSGRRLLGIGPEEDIAATTMAAEWTSSLVMTEGLPAAIRDGAWSGETTVLGRDGHEIPASQVIVAHKTPDGEVSYFSTIVRDLTEHKRAEQVLKENQVRLELHNHISTAMTSGLPVEQIIKIAIKQLSNSFPSLCPTYSQVSEQGLATLSYVLDREGLPCLKGLQMDLAAAPAFRQALEGGEPVMVEDLAGDIRSAPIAEALLTRGVHALLATSVRQGTQPAGLLCLYAVEPKTWTPHEAVTLTSAAESLSLALKNASVEQERRRAEEQLRHDALHDALTGLPNRSLFMSHLGRSFDRAKRHKDYLFAVLFLDLDRFKVINDSLGHLMGDELLISVSRRLSACLRSIDTVARLGGDEFAILLDGLTGVMEATEVAERIQQALTHPVMLGVSEVRVSASIGIALSTTGYDLPSDVLRDADLALYRAKAKGNACHEVYDQTMHTKAVTLLQLETDLRRALKQEELLLHYQPIVSLATGQITAFEALARWHHPRRGLISPADFIPVAEDTGLIMPLGQWALRTACSQMRAWRERFPAQPHLSVCVNLSAKQFTRPDLVEQIAQILRETGLEPSALGLEITETVIMEQAERATAMLKELRALNIPLHLDDFGTGYSSLSYLHRFPIDILKIDRSFVSRIGDSGQHSEIVRAIVSLAHNLKIEVIAEGVETAEQLALLKTLQCDYGQGHYFSKPVEAHAVAEMLAVGMPWCQLAGV